MRRGLRSAASTDRATIPDVDPPRPQPRRNTTTSILSPSHGTCSGVSPARSYRQAVEKGGAPATAAPSASPMMHLPGGASAAAGAALQEDTRGGQVLQAATMSKSEKLGLHVLASSPDVTDARSSLVPGGEGGATEVPDKTQEPCDACWDACDRGCFQCRHSERRPTDAKGGEATAYRQVPRGSAGQR